MQVSLVQTRRFIELFVEERTHFYRRMPGESAYGRLDRYLVDQYVQEHLTGKYTVACPRADATAVLAVDLHAQSRGTETLFQRYQRVRALVPPSAVFWSGDEATLQMMWLLAEQVPTVPASAMLVRYLETSGIQVGTHRSCSEEHVRLPLGQDSVLVDPQTLDPLPTLHDDAEAAIEFITAISRQRVDVLLERMAAASAPTTGTTTTLTGQEMGQLEKATAGLERRQRRNQLLFLIDVVLRFKASGRNILPLPKRLLVQLDGSHSGTYQRRLEFATSSGLLVAQGRPSHRRPRNFRLNLTPAWTGSQLVGPTPTAHLQAHEAEPQTI